MLASLPPMITWRGQSLKHLPRNELEVAAEQAATRLMEMSEAQRLREQADAVMLSGLAGTMLALAAVALGLMLK
jgi:ABC-type arginine transport system ATPase subunit